VANADIACQAHHVSMAKDISDKAVGLALRQAVLVTPGYYTGSILTSVLHDGQRVVKILTNRLCTDNSDNATHGSTSP
jgi:hypothetical protein